MWLCNSLNAHVLKQPPYENPEWFYRHVEMHSLCIEIPTGDCEIPIRCGWKGTLTVFVVVFFNCKC